MIKMEPTVPVVSTSEAERLWLESPDTEAFLVRLRELGSHKVESIKLLRNVANITLGEAKEIVHFSKAWEDRRAADDRFHDDLFEALEKAGFEEQEHSAIAS